ncbi:MAG: DNA-directed RNA polymerase subunit omega [Acidobacteriota bacterium]
MPEPLVDVDSTFRHILIAAKRAEQLIGGARVRSTSRHVKPTTIALEELRCGLVPWRPVTPEEYELLRQEEMAAREKEDHAPAILAAPRPPVVAVEEPELEEDEELEELEDELEGPDFESGELGEVDVEEAVAEDLLPTEE